MSSSSNQPVPLPPDHEQRRVIAEQLDATMLVEAAAGTGKTTSMIQRMIGLLRSGRCQIENLVAVTFTRKATGELRSRFQVELELAAHHETGEAGSRLKAAVSHIERCVIGTIHSFCGRLLRERPIEAEVALDFQELEPPVDEQLQSDAWDDFVAQQFATDPALIDELDQLGLKINDLRDDFRTFVTYPDVAEWPAPLKFICALI